MEPSEAEARDYETTDEIVAYVAARGLVITPPQLARWHSIGPLRRPMQVRLGRGRGSESRYAPGTAELVVGALRREEHPRDLRAFAFELWLDGYEVPIERVRAYLEAFARWHDCAVAALRVFGFARSLLPRPARELVRRAARRRLRVRGLPGFAARLGNADRVETVLRAALQVATGGYERSYQVAIHDEVSGDGAAAPASTDSDALLLERALGLGSARVDRILGVGPWLQGDPTDDLVDLTQLLGGPWLPFVRAVSDDELRDARAHARDLAELFVSVGDVYRAHFGQVAFGFPALADALRSPSVWQRAALVVVLLRALRDDSLNANVAQLREMATRWRVEYAPMLSKIELLRREVPALAALLAPERMEAAMRDEAAFDSYQAELRAEGEANRERIEAVIRKMPPGSAPS